MKCYHQTSEECELVKAMGANLPKYDGKCDAAALRTYIRRHDEYFSFIRDRVSERMQATFAAQRLTKDAADF
ncbi:MAG: hypothetical protein BJ554DRAFT_1799 [Olpidium bornovanus]|uniref:Uncharacterized protein n=1 Tax=Olpidium bornovanus TaxID=278681 RepID=A0A8H7ZRG8_9FUNG|nr:MAG: hypothetical protein BJ554DRAFT_1799 [Olpidium bornovanus]